MVYNGKQAQRMRRKEARRLMYKLLLVDDEAEIREGLKEVVPFERLGFTVVGEAGNGVEALQLCQQTEPDLLITDIRMPLMDGLTLCQKARESLPTLRTIILSGYDDFEYARQAIGLKAMGYLLKPISSGEFTEMLTGARQTLDEEFARRRDTRRLEELFQESLPALRESLLGALLSGSYPAGRILESARKYKLDLEAPAYVLALVRIDERGGESTIEDRELTMLAMRNTLSEALSEPERPDQRLTFFSYQGDLAILAQLQDGGEARVAQWLEDIEHARRVVRRYLGCGICAGIGETCTRLPQLAQAAKGALAALNQAMLSREARVLCVTDIENRFDGALRVDDALLSSLSAGIRARDEALSRKTLDQLLDACRQGSPSARAWQTYLLEILLCDLRIVSENALSGGALDAQLDALMHSVLYACPTVDEAREALMNLTDSLLCAVRDCRQSSSRTLSDQARLYLQAHYAQEDLSVESLCLHLHISPSYFSMIFKKETKKTFLQYLTDLRMEKALGLLSGGDLKISEIARSVGLPDPSYFCYCFKKHFGYPPSRARGREGGAR